MYRSTLLDSKVNTPRFRVSLLLTIVLSSISPAWAQKSEPANVYLFPAGAQVGTTVEASLAGENVTGRCDFHLTSGRGVTAPKEAVAKRIKMRVAPDATSGVVMWRIATAQGGTGSRGFAIGEYPEIVEREVNSEEAADVKLPVTVNGRINPDGDIDRYTVDLKAGQPFSAEVMAARLGGPIDTNCFVGQFGNPPGDVAYMQLDSSLELYGPDGRLLSQAEDTFGLDPALGFIAPQSGRYTVLVRHMAMAGMPQFVYRLTLAEKPLVWSAYPAGGRRGSTVSVALAGQGLAPNSREEVKLDGPARAGGRPLEVSELPESVETEPNDVAASAQAVTLPAVLNGRLQKAADTDLYRVSLKKGETWRFEAFVRRLGSPTEASITVLDAKGAALASADAPPNGDPELTFSAPADGEYLLQVRESAMSRLGERLVYRLAAVPQLPDFTVQIASEFLDLGPGGSGEVEVSVKRLGGFAGAVKMGVEGLPEGVTATPLEIAGNQDKAKLKLTSAKGGRSGSWVLRVIGSADIGGQTVSHAAVAPVANPGESGLGSAPRTVEDLLLTVRFPAPFRFDADDSYLFLNLGSIHQARVFIERDPGFSGPLRLSVADRLPRNPYGIEFEPTVVTELGKEAFIPMRLPQGPRGNEISRTFVKAEAVVKDADGREWHVLQTAKKNTVCRCLAPLLSLAVAPDAVRAKRNGTVRLRFTLGRTAQSMAGAEIRLLPSTEVKGVTMEPVTVGAGEAEVNGTLKIAPDADLGKATELWFEVVSKRDTGQTIFYQAKLIFDLRQ